MTATITIGARAFRRGDPPLLADGAWGTEFLKRGLAAGASPEEWNLTDRAAVIEVARAYVQAGADIILTNTFGGSSLQLKRHGLAVRAAEINRVGAEISRAAADSAGRTVLVAGDVGPSGKLFLMGEVGESELYDSFAVQAASLKAGGADLLVVETMTDRGEMEVAVRAAAATGLPVVASMTYEKGASGYRTLMGQAPEDCVADAGAAGAAAVGANCGAGIETYVKLAGILRGLSDLPLWIKANAGLPELVDGRAVYRMTAPDYVGYVPALLEAGVDIIGGCCGTTPEFIDAIRRFLDARPS